MMAKPGSGSHVSGWDADRSKMLDPINVDPEHMNSSRLGTVVGMLLLPNILNDIFYSRGSSCEVFMG
jgi:hypothetical protein